MVTQVAQTQLASIGSRFLALVIDGLVLGFFTGLVFSALGSLPQEGLVTFLFTFAYQWYFLVHRQGQTPGKMLLNIRVVKTGGQPLGTLDALSRTLGYTLNWATLGFGWWLAFANKNHQGLHDLLADTYVVQAG